MVWVSLNSKNFEPRYPQTFNLWGFGDAWGMLNRGPCWGSLRKNISMSCHPGWWTASIILSFPYTSNILSIQPWVIGMGSVSGKCMSHSSEWEWNFPLPSCPMFVDVFTPKALAREMIPNLFDLRRFFFWTKLGWWKTINLAILRLWPFWDGEWKRDPFKGCKRDLQRLGIKRSRIESPGTSYYIVGGKIACFSQTYAIPGPQKGHDWHEPSDQASNFQWHFGPSKKWWVFV